MDGLIYILNRTLKNITIVIRNIPHDIIKFSTHYFLFDYSGDILGNSF